MTYKTLASALLATTMLTACQGGGSAVNTVKRELSSTANINFAAISGEIAALEAAVMEAQGASSLSAILNPTEADKRMAGDIVSKIDNVINSWDSQGRNECQTLGSKTSRS